MAQQSLQASAKKKIRAMGSLFYGRATSCLTKRYAESYISAQMRRLVHIAHWGERATFLQGKLLLAKGPDESGLALINRALDATRTTETRLAWTWMAAETVAEYLRIGNIEGGCKLLIEAFELMERNDERNWEAELFRLKGALARSASDGIEAEACFHHALDIARHQQAKSLELRAAISLTRLWQSQDKRQDAYNLLAPVYEWFTEGFDRLT